MAQETNEGIPLPPTIEIEICGQKMILNPMAPDFHTDLDKVVKRLKAWGLLRRSYEEECSKLSDGN